MVTPSPWIEAESRALDLRELTRDWFLFLSACRRQVQAFPADPDWMRGRLEDLLAEMEKRSKGDPRLEATYQDAIYALVYLADEILLTSGWAGEAAWSGDLLETRRFGTQHAGLDFFTRLDKAMEQENEQLLEVFFRALCLGFKGKLVKQPEAIHNLRRDLYRRLPAGRIQGTRFCPEAYEATDVRAFVKLPIVASARLAVLLAAFLLIIFFIGRFLFQRNVSDLRDDASAFVKTEQSEAGADGEDD